MIDEFIHHPIRRRTFIKGACSAVALVAVPGYIREVLGDMSSPVGPGPEDLRRILRKALERGGDFADVYLETRVETSLNLADSEIQSVEYGIVQGGGIRTVAGEKTGYAYAETMDPDILLEVADTAASIAHSDPRKPSHLVRIDAHRIITTKSALEDASIADRVSILDRVDRAARAVNPAVKQVSIGYRDTAQRMTIATSDGELVYDRLPMIYLRVTVTAIDGERRAEGMYRAAAREGMEFLAGDTPEIAGRKAAEQAIRMLDAVPAPTGELPVVVAAGGGVMFHEAVGHGLEADGVLRDASVFAGRVGEDVASELVTLYDDSTIPGKRGSFNVDDEATPASKTLLIERGKLVGYMQDKRTARNMGVAVTGNGRRQSFRHPVLVRMTNTNLAPGTDDPEEIIRETKRGIYAVDFGGGQVDMANGQFTFGLREAYLIEDGKVTAPMKGANLVGAGIQVLERIDRVAGDFGSWPGTCGKGGQWSPVTSGCPTLRISGITVGGTA